MLGHQTKRGVKRQPQGTMLALWTLPPPAGSAWEAAGASRCDLVRFDASWRDLLPQATAMRPLGLGVWTWRFITDGLFLTCTGRRQSRHQGVHQLAVWADGHVAQHPILADADSDRVLCLFQGLDRRTRDVCIYFATTSTLELAAVDIEHGATILPAPALRWRSWGDSIAQGMLCPSSRMSYARCVADSLSCAVIGWCFGGTRFPDPMTALKEGRIAGAGLDVLTTEPLLTDHSLLQLDNAILTPHYGGRTFEAKERQSMEGARRVGQILEGRWPDDLLNPSVLDERGHP